MERKSTPAVKLARKPNHDARFVRRLRAWFDIYDIGFSEASIDHSNRLVIIFDDIQRRNASPSPKIRDKSEASSLTITLDGNNKVVFSRKYPDGFAMRIVKDGKQHERKLHIEEALDISRFFGFNDELD